MYASSLTNIRNFLGKDSISTAIGFVSGYSETPTRIRAEIINTLKSEHFSTMTQNEGVPKEETCKCGSDVFSAIFYLTIFISF